MKAALTISERNGMLKTYELMARHFGWDKPPKAASAAETMGYLLDRALRAQGIVSLDSICHLDAPSKKAICTVDRATGPPQRAGAGRAGRRGQAGALGPPGSLARGARTKRGRRGIRTGPHPLAVRSPDHPAQAHPSVLRLRAPFRGLCAEGEAPLRLFRAAGTGRPRYRRRDRPQDRPGQTGNC